MPKINEDFYKWDFKRTLSQGKLAYYIGLSCYIILGVVDFWFLKEAIFNQVLSIRIIAILIGLVIFYLAYYTALKKWHQLFIAFISFISSYSIIFIIHIIPLEFHSYYFPVIILSIFWSHTFSGTHFIYAFSVDIFIAVLFNVSTIPGESPLYHILSHNLFLFSSIIIAGSAGYLLEKSKNKLFINDRKLIQALENNPMPIIMTDITGIIVYVNPSFEKLTGYTSKELIGSTHRIMKSNHHSDEFYKDLWESVLAGEVWKGEIYNKRKNGEFFWEKMVVSSISDEDGNISHFIAVKEDITEQKRIERLREDTERMLKHDLLNPLNGIIAFSDIISINISEGEKIKKYANLINESGNQMLYRIQHSLDLFKMEEGIYELKLDEINLNIMLKKLKSDFVYLMDKKKINLIYFVNGSSIDKADDYYICADCIHIYSMFENLIKNAIEASPENSRVSVDITKQNDEHHIKIHNFGVVPDEIKSRFFDRYITSGKANGTGLGTYSAKLIARVHGGNISFRSLEKEGTTLYVTLPEMPLNE